MSEHSLALVSFLVWLILERKRVQMIFCRLSHHLEFKYYKIFTLMSYSLVVIPVSWMIDHPSLMVSFLNLVNSVRLIFLLKMPKFPGLQADFEIWVKYSFLSPKVRYGLVWLVGWVQIHFVT